MKFTTQLIIGALLGFVLSTSAVAELSIQDRDAWLTKATSLVEAGNIDGIDALLKETLGPEMEKEVEELCGPLHKQLSGRKALYTDKIDHVETGRTFDQHIYAAYYGQREFVFFSFTFARLENGWQLYALDYADSLDRLIPPTQ